MARRGNRCKFRRVVPVIAKLISKSDLANTCFEHSFKGAPLNVYKPFIEACLVVSQRQKSKNLGAKPNRAKAGRFGTAAFETPHTCSTYNAPMS
jgi:hypothetical protein